MRNGYALPLTALVAITAFAACGDEDDGIGFSTAGSSGMSQGGKNTGGAGSASGGTAGQAGAPSAGSSGSAGTPGTGGNTGGGAGGGMTAGMGGAPAELGGAAGEAAGGVPGGEGGAAAGAAGVGGAGGEGGGDAVEPSALCNKDLWKYTFQFCPHGFDGSENQPQLAVDGNTSTYVTSGKGQDGTFYALFDLHGQVDLQNITLDYGDGAKTGDAAATLKLQGSNDGSTFTDIIANIDGFLNNNLLQIPVSSNSKWRYIKLIETSVSGSWWAIPELSISCGEGVADAVPADAGTATDRTQWKIKTPNSLCPATGPVGNMVDADMATGWQSVGRPGVGYWVHVDLGTTAALKGIHLNHTAGDFPATLKVQVSLDDVTYQDAKVALPGAMDMDVLFDSTINARFIRVVSEADTNGSWWTVTDLNIEL